MEDLVADLSLQELERYKYEDIPADNAIRILTLYLGAPGTRLEGRLEFANLDDKPRYEAISYVWGDPTRCEEIIINNKSLALTQSISEALQRMRLEDEPCAIWADQVCINQDDLSERGHQVKLMGRIYKNTTNVLVWLGRDEESLAKPALNIFEALYERFRDDERLDQFTEAQKEHPEMFDDGSWRPLRKFYELPWFIRVWVGQEAGTGAPMELFWGTERYEWNLVLFVSNTLGWHHKQLRQLHRLKPSRVGYLEKRFVVSTDKDDSQGYHPHASFVYELHECRRKRASDPRDRIYANLGHFSAAVLQDSLPPFEADYTLGIVDLSTDVALRTLQGYPTLELLNAVQHLNDDKSLPSWVPDWGNNSKRSPMGYCDVWFRAAGDTAPSLNIEESVKLLNIKGLEFDAIETSSVEFRSKHFDFGQLQGTRARENILPKLWNEICQFSHFNLGHSYIGGGSALLAFCQVLSAGCFQMIRGSKEFRRDYPSNPSNMWLKHGAAYLTRVLGGTNLIAEDVKNAGEGGDAFAWNRSADKVCYSRCFFRTAKGYYGLGPSELEINDVVVVLFGGTTPYVLRPTDQGYYFVGECYVHGLMNGEAIAMMERGELKEKTFEIR